MHIVEGDCNADIDRIVSLVPPHGLNIALIDPFGPTPLKWSTIAKLGAVKRMDLLIHFPTGAIKRNLLHSGFDRTIDEMLGTPAWRKVVLSAEHVPKLIDILREQLVGLRERAGQHARRQGREEPAALPFGVRVEGRARHFDLEEHHEA